MREGKKWRRQGIGRRAVGEDYEMEERTDGGKFGGHMERENTRRGREKEGGVWRWKREGTV